MVNSCISFQRIHSTRYRQISVQLTGKIYRNQHTLIRWGNRIIFRGDDGVE